MEKASHIVALEKPGKGVPCCSVDLPISLPKLGLDVIEPKTRVEGLLIGGGHELAAAPERRAVEGEAPRRRVVGELAEMAVTSRRLDENRAGVHGRRRHDLCARAAGEPQ